MRRTTSIAIDESEASFFPDGLARVLLEVRHGEERVPRTGFETFWSELTKALANVAQGWRAPFDP